MSKRVQPSQTLGKPLLKRVEMASRERMFHNMGWERSRVGKKNIFFGSCPLHLTNIGWIYIYNAK